MSDSLLARKVEIGPTINDSVPTAPGTPSVHGSPSAMDQSEDQVHLEMASPFLPSTDQRVPFDEAYSDQLQQVKRILNESGLFSPELVEKTTTDYYRKLGLNEYYFATTTPDAVAGHIKCVIAAKILHHVSDDDFFPLIHQRIGSQCLVMSRGSLDASSASKSFSVERMVEKEYLNFEGLGESWRLQGCRSRHSVFDDPKCDEERLRTCFLQKPTYPISAEVDPNETDLAKIADVEFWKYKKSTGSGHIFDSLNRQVVSDHSGLNLFVNKEIRTNDSCRLDFAFRRTKGQENFYSNVGDIIRACGMYSLYKHVEPLANGVSIMTLFLRSASGGSVEEHADQAIRAVRMRHVFPSSRYNELCIGERRTLRVVEAAYCHCAAKFIFQFSRSVGPAFVKIANVLENASGISSRDIYGVRTRLKQSPFTEEEIFQVVKAYPDVAKRFYQEFRCNFHPIHAAAVKTFQEDSSLTADIQRVDSAEALAIFPWFRLFNKSITKTNFYKDDRLALAFRVDPSVLPESDFPDRPYAVVFIAGNHFKGFHVRFANIARGGIRIVQSLSAQQYSNNNSRAFDEVYNLSLTQTRKNKDIAEGGSKGIILLDRTESREETALMTRNAFVRYVDAFLDLLLPHNRVVDRVGPEVCFLGPDEFTGKLMDWAALHAKNRGGWFWRAFTTGKDLSLGGIPHDLYGMTTASVEAFVRGALRKLQLSEEDVTKFQTGGPDGDLGSNAILASKCKLTALVDGAGVLYDPEGLDRAEMLRLVQRRADGLVTSSMEFDAAKLSAKGFKVALEDRDVKLPDGTIVANGLEFRNEFHLNPLSSATLFNPCGGRPESITPLNVDRLFFDNGTPRFKVIVEGANVFITQDARITLERRGVVLFKDASANKGGVTSSSLEVLAALALSEDEFQNLMTVKDVDNPPEFYKKYVAAIKDKIAENAEQEFEVLWREGIRTSTPRCKLTDLLSARIIQLKNELLSSPLLWKDEELQSVVLHKAIPKVLMPDFFDLKTLLKRVPESYMKAIFSSYLASRFYYSNGIDASSFAFLEFAYGLKVTTDL